MKHLISSIFVLMSICMYSCSDNNSDEPDFDSKESIVGHWQKVMYYGNIPLGIGYTFNADGTGYLEGASYDDEKDDGSVSYFKNDFIYSIDGHTLFLYKGSEFNQTEYSITNNTLKIDIGDEEDPEIVALEKTSKSFGETFGYK